MARTDGDGPPRATEDRLEALYQLAVELSELRDLQQVLDLSLRHCLELTGSEFGFIGLNTADGRSMDVRALQGYHVSQDFYERFHLLMPLRAALLAHAAHENQPVRAMDAMSAEDRVGQPRGHPPVHAFLGVPLRLRGSPIGMLGVANRAGGYALEHEHLLATYAAQVAIAIHNARLHQQAQEIAISEERARIAREMHDNLAQVLFYATAQIDVVRTLVQAEQAERAVEELERLAHAVREAYADVREEVLALHTAATTHGLQESLGAYLPLWERQSGLRATLTVTAAGAALPTLAPTAAVQLVRIVQEALTNARKHARAQHVRVQINATATQVTVVVEDDGTGFDPAVRTSSSGPHFGLAMMRERADAIGGHFAVDAASGRGTRVIVRVPVEAAPQELAQHG